MLHNYPLSLVAVRLQFSELIKLRLTSKKLVALIVFSSLLALSPSVFAEEVSDIPGIDIDVPAAQESTQIRIVGGNVVENDKWPSLVSLVSAGDEERRVRHFCGGSVVAERWVLTAAHCMFNEDGSPLTPDQFLVVAGMNDLRDENVVDTVVSNVYIHPGYEHAVALTDDIALVELATSVSVPANDVSSTNPETLVGASAFIAGWGLLADIETASEGDQLFQYQLADASVPIVSLAQCNSPESYDGFIVNTQLCAGLREGGVDACQGDSGGPLYVLQGSRQVQIGVTSWGLGCGRPNYYGVYTDVNSYRGWMSNYITLEAGAIGLNELVTIGSDVVGSVHQLLLGLLSGVVLLRLFSRFSSITNQRRSTRGSLPAGSISMLCRRRYGVLTAALLSASACSSNLPIIDGVGEPAAISTLPDDTKLTKSNAEQEAAVTELNLSEIDGKAGIGQLQLGSTYQTVMDSANMSGFASPECDASPTAIKGTGRLFIQHLCRAKPLGKVSLEGVDVESLELRLLDKRLIKIDINFHGGDATALTRQLDVRYEHVPSAQRPFEWRLGNDHIRIVSSSTAADDGISRMSLQMIDGRLSDKLPALFDYP